MFNESKEKTSLHFLLEILLHLFQNKSQKLPYHSITIEIKVKTFHLFLLVRSTQIGVLERSTFIVYIILQNTVYYIYVRKMIWID